MRTSAFITGIVVFSFLSCEEQEDHSKHAGMHHDSVPPAATHHVHADHSQMIVLSAYEQMLAGIRTDTVRINDFQEGITALGIVESDAGSVSVLTAKVDGRIDYLYARYPGSDLSAGQAVMDIYSETLLAAQMDLLGLINSNAPASFITAARQKLILYGLTDAQVDNMIKQKTASARMTIYSNASGFISRLSVREGQYISTGDVLVEVSSLDEVIVNAQVYSEEINAFETAKTIQVKLQETIYEATRWHANPAMEAGSNLLNVRLRVNNAGHLLRPGMMVNVYAVSAVEQVVTIPRTALLFGEGMWFTWVREPDGMFNRRMVRIGRENQTHVEIVEGLEAGETLVVSGTYLLNSEYILRNGANAMAGMEHM